MWWLLDLDHLCAEVGHDGRSGRPGDVGAAINHTQSGKYILAIIHDWFLGGNSCYFFVASLISDVRSYNVALRFPDIFIFPCLPLTSYSTTMLFKSGRLFRVIVPPLTLISFSTSLKSASKKSASLNSLFPTLITSHCMVLGRTLLVPPFPAPNPSASKASPPDPLEQSIYL